MIYAHASVPPSFRTTALDLRAPEGRQAGDDALVIEATDLKLRPLKLEKPPTTLQWRFRGEPVTRREDMDVRVRSDPWAKGRSACEDSDRAADNP
jgi:hypothetical protein